MLQVCHRNVLWTKLMSTSGYREGLTFNMTTYRYKKSVFSPSFSLDKSSHLVSFYKTFTNHEVFSLFQNLSSGPDWNPKRAGFGPRTVCLTPMIYICNLTVSDSIQSEFTDLKPQLFGTLLLDVQKWQKRLCSSWTTTVLFFADFGTAECFTKVCLQFQNAVCIFIVRKCPCPPLVTI